MKIAAVIAEYNPLHEGHQYHMEQTRQITGADYIITILSGDFVQRGLPAVEEKFVRTKKALLAGSDLVLELPLPYALSSAQGFAFGGVSLAQGLGCVDDLSFGLEDEEDLEPLKALAHVLSLPSEGYSHLSEMYGRIPSAMQTGQTDPGIDVCIPEPILYNNALQNALKKGKSYPAAVAQAVSEAYPELDTRFLTQKQNSNTLLALEYLQALYRLNTPITPVAVRRQGMPYLSESGSGYPSATALRARLQKTEPANSSLLFPRDFSSLLHYRLLSESYDDLLHYREMTPQLAHKIQNALPAFEDFEQFAGLLWTKDTTYARTCRTLSYIILGIKKDTWDVHAQVPYARILGFRKSAAPLLHQLRESAAIPVISKLADAPAALSSQAQQLLELEVKASQIYDSVRYHKSGKRLPGEYQKSVISVNS
ncbi:MAG: nucleotidyltransferase family protein [Lachnospiraceae bacterium]|nr:nucleotidyltransferase family protein [Lachnospiraceae bacterium]